MTRTLPTPTPEDFDEQDRRFHEIDTCDALLRLVDGDAAERARLEVRRSEAIRLVRDWDLRFGRVRSSGGE